MSVDPINNQAVPASPPPPPSGGQVPQVYSGAFERFVPIPGFVRLDIEVLGGDAYVQLTESIDRTWPAPEGEEFLLREGTHSIPLAQRAYGWRVRSASSTAGVTVTARTIG